MDELLKENLRLLNEINSYTPSTTHEEADMMCKESIVIPEFTEVDREEVDGKLQRILLRCKWLGVIR